MYRFQYKAYRRSFSKQWTTASQAWRLREGILVKIEDRDGKPGYGEIAPIEQFGSESFLSALGVCAALDERLEYEIVGDFLAGSPATRFAIESAISMLAWHGAWPTLEKPWPVCGLLRDGLDEDEWSRLLDLGFRCLKSKIGVGDFSRERRAIERFASATGGEIGLRLDANGGLDGRRTREWMEFLSEIPGVEFIEQPMSKGNEDTMERLCGDYPTPIALDESVCQVDDLKRWRDRQWPGVFVIKPLLAGSAIDLDEELAQGEIDAVYSSALETRIGAANGLGLAIRRPATRRALGFDTNKLFVDRTTGLELGPFLQPGAFPRVEELEELWSRI